MKIKIKLFFHIFFFNNFTISLKLIDFSLIHLFKSEMIQMHVGWVFVCQISYSNEKPANAKESAVTRVTTGNKG
jgi:hypothetical protein